MGVDKAKSFPRLQDLPECTEREPIICIQSLLAAGQQTPSPLTELGTGTYKDNFRKTLPP